MKKKITVFLPLLSVVLVAACAAVSLSGYTPEVYAVKTPEQTETAEIAMDTAEPETVPVNDPGKGKGDTTVAAVQDAVAYRDGTYYGTADGFAGPLTVKVVVADGKITFIEVTESKDDAGFLNRAKSLISKIISGQTTNVDTISGATYSSVGIINAVRNALAQAALSDSALEGETPMALAQSQQTSQKLTPASGGTIPYADGIYYGTGEGYGGDITVAVVIQDHTIKAVLITDAQYEDESFFNRASVVAENVVAAQSTAVDTVSGATYSSRGILEAIENALLEAKKATEDTAGIHNLPEEPEASDNVPKVPADVPEEEPGTESGPWIYADGEYDVVVLCEPDEDEDFETYNLSVKITFKNDRITAVTDVFGDGDASNDSYIRKAVNGTSKYPGIISQVLALENNELTEEKLDELDTVSMATCTSNSIREACRVAMSRARQLLTQRVKEQPSDARTEELITEEKEYENILD